MKKLVLALIISCSFYSLSQAEYKHVNLVPVFNNVVTDKITYEKIKDSNVPLETIEELYNKVISSRLANEIEYASNGKIVVYVNKKENRIVSVIII